MAVPATGNNGGNNNGRAVCLRRMGFKCCVLSGLMEGPFARDEWASSAAYCLA